MTCERRLSEGHRIIQLLRQLHSHVHEGTLLHFESTKAVLQIMTGALKYSRGAAAQDVINMSGEHSRRHPFIIENREQSGVKGGGFEAQTYQLERFIRLDQIAIQGLMEFRWGIIQPIGRGIETPHATRIARTPLPRGL